MQSEMQKPPQVRRQIPNEDNLSYAPEAPSAPQFTQEDHTNVQFNPDSVAIENYLQTLGIDKTSAPQQQQAPMIQQIKKEPQKVVQTIPQLVPNNNYATATTTSPPTTASGLVQSANNVQQQQQLQLQQQQQLLQQQLQQQQLLQLQQLRPVASVSKESQQLDQLAYSIAGLSNQMQQAVKSLSNLDERLTSLETKIDTVILKQRTLEEISRDNNRIIQKRDEFKPAIPIASPVTADIYNMPPSNNLPYNINNPVVGTQIQPQMATPVQYVSPPSALPTGSSANYSNPQNTRPAPARPSGASLYPGMTAVQPQPAKTATAPRVTVKFDERLIADAVNMGFERQVVVDTLYELYGAGQPANDINVLIEKLTKGAR